ncbi:MAG: hypothetical protein IVW55_13010, partial [Chloroflexi bacterium]|nr:hypothetical protein [Chloroflexota bacterium]
MKNVIAKWTNKDAHRLLVFLTILALLLTTVATGFAQTSSGSSTGSSVTAGSVASGQGSQAASSTGKGGPSGIVSKGGGSTQAPSATGNGAPGSNPISGRPIATLVPHPVARATSEPNPRPKPGAEQPTSTALKSSNSGDSPDPRRTATPTAEPCDSSELDATIGTPSGGSVTARIRNISTNCTFHVGLASYERVDDNIDNQILFDSSEADLAPGESIDLSVSLPNCAYQVDAFRGALITNFHGGVRYGNRLLDDIVGGGAYCVEGTGTPTETETSVPATHTPVPPTSTSTHVPSTSTPTETEVPATHTPVPPTSTSTHVPSTSTPTETEVP